MEACNGLLTFESMDKILHSDHSDGTFLPIME